jgi:ABC-type antimicrobial peptide transport system permease subunit
VYVIVGVSADHKVSTIAEAPTPFIHVARSQQPNAYSAIIARTPGDANALLRDMRRELLALEPNLVFFENQTMEAEMSATLFPARAEALVVGTVGVVALLLAAIGLYGVIAYSVSRRTREIGIRMALGASASTVLRLVMRQGLIVAVAGLGVGFAVGCIAAALARSEISGMLYGVSLADPLSWGIAAAVLLGASTLANFIPAWRAARVQPSQALRTE